MYTRLRIAGRVGLRQKAELRIILITGRLGSAVAGADAREAAVARGRGIIFSFCVGCSVVAGGSGPAVSVFLVVSQVLFLFS